MRRLLCLASFCCLLATTLFVTPVEAARDSVAWHTDLDEAFEVARETNRPLLLHFWTPDCIPCRRLERNVFNQPRVVETLENQFVPVKINAQEFPELAARYHVSSVPKDVILNTRDEELLRLFTPQAPDQYVAQLSAVVLRNGGVAMGSRARTTEVPSSAKQAAEKAADRRSSDLSSTDQEMPPSASGSEPTEDAKVAAASKESRFPQPPVAAEPREVINRFAMRNRGAGGVADLGREDQRKDGGRNGEQSDDVSETPVQSVESTSSPVRRARQPQAFDAPASASHPIEQQVRESVSESDADLTAAIGVAPASSVSESYGLEGYCPVTLLQNNAWRKGDRSHGAVHRGKTYLFASDAEKKTFLADPDSFSPALSGIDPVALSTGGEITEGRRAHGLVYRNRVYMFSCEKNLETFLARPEYFTKQIEQAMEAGDLSVFRR